MGDFDSVSNLLEEEPETLESLLSEADDIGNLELEEFESVEELSHSGSDSIPAETMDDLQEDQPFGVPQTVRAFINSIFPVLFIDKDMKILYANKACENLFTGFFKLVGNLFIDVFGKYFNLSDVRNMREAMVSGINGSSWKGIARIKSRSMATVETRVYIFPLNLNLKNVQEFVVMFDDVTEENRRLLRSVFMSLLEASKLKDNDTGKHITRVNYYSRALAQNLFNRGDYDSIIDADFIDNIGFLASMHDVGKIGTPDDILNKEGPLSDWEWNVMQEHTKNGAFILSTYPNPMAKEIALSHHERWDGSGYPFQLEGEMIPLAARIVTIADVYDALRMERSYKPALNHELTVSKMVEGRGVHFDPSLLDVFINISDDFEAIYEANKD
ncbi:MAG: HD domain-containing protein [Spirochaetaceae bacterium]|jgi:putative two-component system response regulator|nr:HD domain-containing protein [Spirochaetaceae bacterium]